MLVQNGDLPWYTVKNNLKQIQVNIPYMDPMGLQENHSQTSPKLLSRGS